MREAYISRDGETRSTGISRAFALKSVRSGGFSFVRMRVVGKKAHLVEQRSTGAHTREERL